MSDNSMASSSSEEDDDDNDNDPDTCIINYKKEQKIIKITEELTPQYLATEFGLISIPKFLTYGEKGNRLKCSNPGKSIKVKPGKIYTIPDQDHFDEDKEHVWNAFYCSKAAYEEDPHTFLQNNLKLHNIDSVGVSVNGHQRIVIGGCSLKKTLYVGYRGSVTREDWETNARITLSTRNNYPGKCHAGFSERADELPASYIVKYALEHDLSTIVTCGHSLGGAVSSVACLNLLRIPITEEVAHLKMFNITFAAPYFCDTQLSNYCKEKKFSNRFFHYVNDLDVAPTLLSVSNTIADVNRMLPALSISNEAKDTIERWFPILRQIGRIVAKGVLPSPAAEFVDNFLPILGKLAEENFKISLGDGALDEDMHDYKPMGNYRFLKDKVHSLGDEAQLIQTHLGIATSIKTHTGLTKAFKAHALDSYEKKMEIMRKEPSMASKDCQALNDIFLPRIDKMEVTWENTKDENQGKCWLSIWGEFIHNIDLQTCEFPLTNNFSFSEKDCKIKRRKYNEQEMIYIEKKVDKTEKANIENKMNISDFGGIKFTISNIFGEKKFTMMKHMIRGEIKIKSVEKLAEELHVADILRRGIQRTIAINNMKNRSSSDWSKENGSMLCEIQRLLYFATGHRVNLKSGIYDLSRCSQNSPIEILIGDVESFFNPKGIENERKKMSFITKFIDGYAFGIGIALTRWGDQNSALAAIEMLAIGMYIGLLGDFMDNLGRKTVIETNYVETLDWYVNKFGGLQGELELTPDEENDLADLAKYDTPYAKEAIILRLWQFWIDKNPQAVINIPGLILDSFSKDRKLRAQEERRLYCIESVHKIRVLFGTQCYLGFTGYEDSGKSTVLQKILPNEDIETGYTKHTSEVTLYPIDDRLTFVDYPGTKGLEAHAEAFRNCGPMNNMIFFLLPFAGEPKEEDYQEIKNAFIIMKVSSSAQIFFCMNKCGLYMKKIVAELKGECTTSEDTPFGKLKERFLDKLNRRKESEGEDVAIDFTHYKNNFLFTDWEVGDTEEAKAAGIVGPNAIIEHIREFLTKKRVYEGREEKIPSILNISS